MIVLRAKNIDFEVTHFTHDTRPDWFWEISPHGKVPVLWVDDEVLFESNAIAEYLDETVEPRLHPADPIKRARNRAWTDYVPDFAAALNAVNYAKTKEAQDEAIEKAKKPLDRVEEALAKDRGNDGPYFNGKDLCIVDAAYAPFLMRFNMVEAICKTGLMKDYPKIQAWTEALLTNDCVKSSVVPEFDEVYEENLVRRETYAATLLDKAAAE